MTAKSARNKGVPQKAANKTAEGRRQTTAGSTERTADAHRLDNR